MPVIATASAADLEDIKVMFREYSALVTEALCFQGFDRELAGLPGDYAPPTGTLLIARDGAAAVGCVALRRLDAGTGEMKRMYVREAFRGTGLGRRLALAIVDEAKRRGYRRVVLDTLPKLSAAIALYRDLGFRETGPYLPSPTPGALCFALSLS
ncbi:MAG TPA: GNAT family N-acetyltransferase [Burkholderiales bacterium]